MQYFLLIILGDELFLMCPNTLLRVAFFRDDTRSNDRKEFDMMRVQDKLEDNLDFSQLFYDFDDV